jgi:hypothetical protein
MDNIVGFIEGMLLHRVVLSAAEYLDLVERSVRAAEQAQFEGTPEYVPAWELIRIAPEPPVGSVGTTDALRAALEMRVDVQVIIGTPNPQWFERLSNE